MGFFSWQENKFLVLFFCLSGIIDFRRSSEKFSLKIRHRKWSVFGCFLETSRLYPKNWCERKGQEKWHFRTFWMPLAGYTFKFKWKWSNFIMNIPHDFLYLSANFTTFNWNNFYMMRNKMWLERKLMSIKYESVKSSKDFGLNFCSLLLRNDKAYSNYLIIWYQKFDFIARAYLERGVKH